MLLRLGVMPVLLLWALGLAGCEREEAPAVVRSNPETKAPSSATVDVERGSYVPGENPDPVVRTYPGETIPEDPAFAEGYRVYLIACSGCHSTGATGALTLRNVDAWRERLAKGTARLYHNAIEGFTGSYGYMPPKGGSPGSWTDAQVKAAVDYMVHSVRRVAEERADRHAAPALIPDRDVLTSQLIGKSVHGVRGVRLGEIIDLVVDVNNDRVHYAVLAAERTGPGHKLFAYPIGMLRPGPGEDDLMVNVEREALDRAPGFDAGRWPDFNDLRYPGDVDRHFGSTVDIRPVSNQLLVRATALIGRTIHDRSGRSVGKARDLVVNLMTGRVRYLALDLGGASTAQGIRPVPLSAVRYPRAIDAPRDRPLRIDFDRAQLRQAASRFEADEWPEVNDPGFRREVDAYLNRLGYSHG